MDMDLNLDNYTIDDLYKLFDIDALDDESMKHAKRIVLKTHPDKSGLDSQYFLFFSRAYKRLYGIMEFQNKSSSVKTRTDVVHADNAIILNNTFGDDTQRFNKWFNEQFNKYNEINDEGYGDWLKTDDGITASSVTNKQEMASEFERQKKRVQALSIYNGVQDTYARTSGAQLSQTSDYTTDEYTDLKKAYMESVIPVTEDDYNSVKKYRNVDELKNDRLQDAPFDKQTSQHILFNSSKRMDDESAALAFHYAKQTEKAKQNNSLVWSNLKQLK
jgi:hypothetical protein